MKLDKSEAMRRLIATLEKELPETDGPPERVPKPKLPPGELSQSDQFTSAMWLIESAEAQGSEALRGLSLVFARLIEADVLRNICLDARDQRNTLATPPDLLWDEEQPLTEDGLRLNELLVPAGQVNLNLGTAAVIANVWEPWRLIRSLQRIGPGLVDGVWRQTTNLDSVAWHPWPLVWVSTGNHSATVGRLRGGGAMTCDSVDASRLLRAVRSDGVSWFRTCDSKCIGHVHSVPMAALFEVGKRLL